MTERAFGPFRGAFDVEVLVDGRPVAGGSVENLVLSVGKETVLDILRGAIQPFQAIALGSGTGAPDVDDPGLLAEVARAALPAPGVDTATQRNVRVGNVVYLKATFPRGLIAPIHEVSLVGGLASPPGALGTGRYFNRAVMGPWVITGIETIRVQGRLRFA